MKLRENSQEWWQDFARKPPSYDALMIALTEQFSKLDEQHNIVNEQHDIITKKSHVIGEQQKQINILEEQLRLLRQQRYGKSSEKNEAQGERFNEVEQLSDSPEFEDNETESSTNKPKKRNKAVPDFPPIYPERKSSCG